MSFSKEDIVKLIKGRIMDEYRKHPLLDWSQSSASKIYSQWFEYFNNEIQSLKEQLSDKEEQIRLKDCAYSDIGNKYSKMLTKLNEFENIKTPHLEILKNWNETAIRNRCPIDPQFFITAYDFRHKDLPFCYRVFFESRKVYVFDCEKYIAGFELTKEEADLIKSYL